VTGGRILVVDDDALLRSSVAAVLSDEGYDVDLACDGIDALARIHAQRPDVILLDVLMPRMNGKALLETLHSNAVTSGISVLVMTALQGFESHRTIALGATDLVEKPFDVDELLNKVALAVYRAQQSGEAGAPEGDPASRGVVLVVGDERRGTSGVERVVSSAGYTPVALVHATHELPRLARLLEPRVIVLIEGLSTGLGGVDALRLVRDEPDLAGVPVVVLDRDGAWNEAERPGSGGDPAVGGGVRGELLRLLA
jgi:two-component system, OmpR family, response regulator MprA